jgi:predicted ester cyclase
MTSDENKLVVRRYLEEVVNTGNVDRIAEFISPEYVEVYRGVRSPVGLDGAREHVLGVRRTYPDLHVAIDRQIAEGEWVVTQVTGRGTHLGSWLGMRPTGKSVEIAAVNVDRVVGGRIVEHGGAANSLEALLEIGAVRVVGTERDAESGASPNGGPSRSSGNSGAPAGRPSVS